MAGTLRNLHRGLIEHTALGASLLCLIHCLALPLLFAALPALSSVIPVSRTIHLEMLAIAVPTSSMAREADLLLPTHAGPEIGVASTKAFTCQLAVLAALAANLARAAVEGLLCSMAYCLDTISEHGVDAERILMVGGAARSQAVRQIAPTILGLDVQVPESAEYVAVGAARQAAWVLAGQQAPPPWEAAGTTVYRGDATPGVRERYEAAQQLTLR